MRWRPWHPPRRTPAFAALAAGVEERLVQLGLSLPADVVDSVVRHRVHDVAVHMGVTDRTALGYANEESADAIAREMVVSARALESGKDRVARRAHLSVVKDLDSD